MDAQSISLWKKRVARVAAGFSILFALFTLDSSVAYLREPSNTLELLPGQSSSLLGPLAPGAEGVSGMTYESTSERVSLALEEVVTGFWFGGKMWKATLGVAPDTAPGTYKIVVFGKVDSRKIKANTFDVVVYRDQAAKQAGAKSLLMRLSGLNSMILAIGSFVLMLVCCACLYFMSGVRDRLMAQQGEAEVYHVKRDKDGASVYFGLGAVHGIKAGARLVLMDERRRPVEEITVDSVDLKDARARAGAQVSVEVGYLVKKI